MSSLEGFDPTQVEPTTPIDLIPAGEYPVILIETDLSKKESGAVQFEFCVQITEGKFQNRRVYSSQNYTKKDGSANAIGRGMVSQVCRCVGVMNPKDTEELHHKRLVAKVGIEKSEGYEPRNNVKGFKVYMGTESQPVQTTPHAANNPGSAAGWAQSVS